MISHDVDLLGDVVNRVWFLDAVRGEVDIYNMGWQQLPATAGHRRAAPPPRTRQRREEGRRAARRRPPSSARRPPRPPRPSTWSRRAEKLLADLEEVRAVDKVARIRFPTPAPCGKTPLTAERLSKVTARWRSSPASTSPSTAAAGSSSSASTARARRRCCACSPASRRPTPASSSPGTACKIGYFAQEHDTLDDTATVLGEHPPRRAGRRGAGAAQAARLVHVHAATQLTSPPARSRAARRPAWRSRAWSSSAANVLLLDEPTNNLDPRAGADPRRAAHYEGAVVLVTHDPGAVEALTPERVILLPDGTEDHWSEDYLELIQLA